MLECSYNAMINTSLRDRGMKKVIEDDLNILFFLYCHDENAPSRSRRFVSEPVSR